MNVAKNLDRSALYFPDRPAISHAGSEISYRALNARSNQVAGALVRWGIQPGDFVGLCAPNSVDWIAFYFGALKAGAVTVTLPASLQTHELRLLLTHSRPRILLTVNQKLDQIEHVRMDAGIERIISENGDMSFSHLAEQGSDTFSTVDRSRDATAAVLYTGGTTGEPKGVMLTHENINVSSHNVSYSERSSETDRALCFLPLNHVFGHVHIMNATVFSSGCVELLPGYDMDRVLTWTASGKITKLYAVPTIYTRLLAVPDLKKKLGAVRYCFSAAASMAVEIVRQWKDETGLTISEGYGMTESASAVTYNHYHRHVIGSVGTAVPGVEVQIRDAQGYALPQGKEGEICIRGRNIMKGYLNNPVDTEDAFWSDGWFRSGDVGALDEDDYLFIVDRLKDMIITGGENVYPREVEEVIYSRPDIQECAVVGLPDKEWGERVTAFVVSRPGKTIIPGDLKSFLKERLAAFKIPKDFVVLDEMPKTAAGKIQKRELKKRHSTEQT
jgi:long-chain acyl-CoA synthetase